MALSLIIPQPGKKGKTKDYIISILGRDWPHSIKQLYNMVKKQFGHDVTYQAVYKTVHELTDEDVLEKDGLLYQINLKWMKNVHRYTEMVETNYYTKNRLNLIEGIKSSDKQGNINVLTFETYFDVEKYLYYLQKHYILSSKKKEIICVHHLHEWRPLYYMRAEYNWMKQLNEQGHQMYILCKGNNYIDKWCADFYRILSCKVKLNANCASTCELIVFGDTVIQIYLPGEIQDKLRKISDKRFTSIDLNLWIKDIFERSTDIKVIINKDKKLAQEIKNQTKHLFLSN